MLTPLNLATTARFLACEGQHTFSGQFIWRCPRGDYEDRPMPVCDRCETPIPGHYKPWSINRIFSETEAA